LRVFERALQQGAVVSMSFGKRGSTAPNTRVVQVAAMTEDAPPPISGKVKLFAWCVLAMMMLAAGGAATYHHFAPAYRSPPNGALGYGVAPMPFAVLRSERALGWSYAGCRLDSSAFVNRDDLRLAFNVIGFMEPEETPVALRASTAFLTCLVRKATETCDTEIRDQLSSDVVVFFKRHSRTKGLVDRMLTHSPSVGGGGMHTMPGMRNGLKDRQAEAASVLSIAESKVGYALQTMVETGYVKPSQFGMFWKPEAITKHLEGIKPGASTCKS
jgi:hypothetical protein